MQGVDEVSGRKWSAIHREAGLQAQCKTWLFAYFDVSWVVHGGPRSQVPHAGFPRTNSSPGGGGGDSAGPRTPTTPAPLPLRAFGQQLVAKGVALRRPWAPKAPDAP